MRIYTFDVQKEVIQLKEKCRVKQEVPMLGNAVLLVLHDRHFEMRDFCRAGARTV